MRRRTVQDGAQIDSGNSGCNWRISMAVSKFTTGHKRDRGIVDMTETNALELGDLEGLDGVLTHARLFTRRALGAVSEDGVNGKTTLKYDT